MVAGVDSWLADAGFDVRPIIKNEINGLEVVL